MRSSACSKHPCTPCWCQTNLDDRKVRNSGHAGGLAYSVLVIHSVTETEKKNQYLYSYQIQIQTCTIRVDYKKPHQYDLTLRSCWRHIPRQQIQTSKSRDCIYSSGDIILLNCFLSETRCGLSQFYWNSPTVLFWATYTSQCGSPPWNWQVTAASPRYQGGAEDGAKTNLAAGPGRYERPWRIWNDSGTAELRRKKAAITKTRVCRRRSLRICPVSLEMRGWNEYWLQCIRSRGGCVYLLCTSLLNLIDYF